MLELPPGWPRHPLAVADYLALGETEFTMELVEGQLTLPPLATPWDREASFRLTKALDAALPTGWGAFQRVGLDLQLAPPDQPGFVRAPDLVVVRTEAVRRVKDDREFRPGCRICVVTS